MEPQKALEILIKGVEHATKYGAFELQDAGIIAQAVNVFKKPTKAEKPLSDNKNKHMEETIPEVVEAPVEVVETQEEVSDAAPESTEEVVA